MTTDRREQRAYPLSEAARYLRLPVATLRSWVVGRHYPKAGNRAPRGKPPLLSFWNLVEAHVLRSLRTEHGVAIRELRGAIAFAERGLGVERLLLSKQLCTQAGQVFLERYGQLINLSASGQLTMRKVLDEHLKRVEWDQRAFPIRLYPFVPGGSSVDMPIVIDPEVAFGRPVVKRTGVSTAAIRSRVDAGESVDSLAQDYGLSVDEIERAIVYERAA